MPVPVGKREPEPMVPKEPTFRKKINGMIGKPDTYSNVKRMFETYDEDHFRAAILRRTSAAEKKETIDYQSWLAAFASFNDGGAPERTQVRIIGRRKRKTKVNNIVACTLLPGETWSEAATRYKQGSINALSERKQHGKGKLQLVHSNTLPPQWEKKRPPTLVQLLAPYHSLSRRTLSNKGCVVEQVAVRKPSMVVAANDHTFIDMPWIRSVRAKANWKKVMQEFLEDCARNPDPSKPKKALKGFKLLNHRARMNQLRARYRNTLQSSERRPLAVLQNREKQLEGGVAREFHSIRSFREHEPIHIHDVEYMAYQSTLAAPMLMSKVRHPHPFVIPSPEALTKFNEEFHFDEWTDHWLNNADDMTRYACWQARMDVHNSRHIRLAIHVDDSYEARLSFMYNQWALGRLRYPVYKKASDRIRTLNNLKKGAFVLVGEPVGDSRKPQSQYKRVNHKLKGLPSPVWSFAPSYKKVTPISELRYPPAPEWCHHQVGLDIQMTAMEYKNITRTEPTSVDEHLLSVNLIGLRDYSAAGLLVHEEFERRRLNKRLGGLSAVGSFKEDESSGLILPDYDSVSLSKFVKDVSLRV